MRSLTQEVLETVRRAEVPLADRSKVVEVTIAEVLACRLSIPSTPVNDLNDYFYAHHKVEIIEALADVNEVCVMDIDRASDLVFRIWRIRYSLVHRPNDPFVGRLVNMATNLNESIIPEVYRKVIRDNPGVALSRTVIEKGYPEPVKEDSNE